MKLDIKNLRDKAEFIKSVGATGLAVEAEIIVGFINHVEKLKKALKEINEDSATLSNAIEVAYGALSEFDSEVDL